MELNGEEKTIRALFREMRLEDERATPTFASEWKRRPARSGTPFSFGRVVVAVAVGCIIVVSTLLLQRQFFGTEPLRPKLTTELASDGKASPEYLSTGDRISPVKNEATKPKPKKPALRRRRFTGARKNERIASSLRRRKGEAGSVSDWQSPTRAFLRSPGEELLRSLRPLNQSSVELGSFLHQPS